MPQMKPLNWLILYISLITILLMINIMNYFKFIIKMNFKNKHKKFTHLYWKW